ncbi:MAG TPA: lactonase family protein [Chitinophagaceae bacterium]
MKLIACCIFLFSTIFAMGQLAPHEQYLLVGTYTSTSAGKSEGIYVYRFNTETGEATYVNKAITENPSFLAVSPDQKFVYAVNEGAKDKGSIAAFSFDRGNGQLTYLNSQPSGGDHPCYVAIDKTGKWVTSGNYSGGSLAVFPVDKTGKLGNQVSHMQHQGYSVNTERQTAPHVHSTVFSPDNKFLFVPDLGIDKVMIYSFNAKNGKLAAAKIPFHMTEAGAGPRHFDFSPNGKFAYLMEEMSGSISAYSYQKGELHLLQNISALPPEYNGAIGSADIHVSPDGKFLYASNRGESNTIAIFKIDAATGMLSVAGHQSTLGKTPRNFNFDPSGNFLLVGNQNSDEIVIFKRDKETGLLTDTKKRIAVGKPVCIKWIR